MTEPTTEERTSVPLSGDLAPHRMKWEVHAANDLPKEERVSLWNETVMVYTLDPEVIDALTKIGLVVTHQHQAVVTITQGERPAYFKCLRCGRRGTRANTDLAVAAVEQHIAEHAQDE
jgi:hypothetical protein